MPYEVKYRSQFTNPAGDTYTIDILENDYVGDIIPFLTTGNPAIHTWQTDEPQAPIKGSSLVVRAFSNPATPDTTYSALSNFTWLPVSSESIIYIDNADLDFTPEVGVPFTISGHIDPVANGTWTPISVFQDVPGDWVIQVESGAFTSDTVQSAITITMGFNAGFELLDFYSINDDQFKVIFYRDTQVLFTGFLVQDDCSEDMVDYIHEIVLSFNDNLGLLKDVPLDENVPDLAGFPATAFFDFVSAVPDNFIYLYNTNFIPEVAVAFSITGHIDPAANDTWTPIDVEALGPGNWKVQVADGSFTDMQAWPVRIDGDATFDLYNRNTLLNVIFICLYNTGLHLETHIYANLFETRHDPSRAFLEQTYIDTQSFITGEGFDNCYNVLTDILGRYKLTVFQSNGVWNIVRWQEMRYGTIPSFTYNAGMEFIAPGTFDRFFTTGFEQDVYPEVGLRKSIFRPFRFVSETFNYEQPKYLLRNFDLTDLGALLDTYTDGANTINEYAFTDWYPSGIPPEPAFFIRVVTDTATGSEVERYVVVKGDTGDNPRSVIATPFEVNEGDRIEVSYTFRTTVSQAGPGTVVLAVMITDDTNTDFADDDPTIDWEPTLGWSYLLPSGDNTNQNQSVTINPGPVPYSGLVYVFLPQAVGTPGPTDETHIKDIRLTYTPYINDSTKIIGHIHESEQDQNIKNNEAVTIAIDDSPRNSVIGTLFLPTFTGLLQDRTFRWYRITTPGEELRIGEITTMEQLYWRMVPRTKQDGTFYGVLDISMLAILKNVAFNELNFIFGMLEINYFNNSFSGTQWEIYADEEEPGVSEYSFNYIYDSK